MLISLSSLSSSPSVSIGELPSFSRSREFEAPGILLRRCLTSAVSWRRTERCSDLTPPSLPCGEPAAGEPPLPVGGAARCGLRLAAAATAECGAAGEWPWAAEFCSSWPRTCTRGSQPFSGSPAQASLLTRWPGRKNPRCHHLHISSFENGPCSTFSRSWYLQRGVSQLSAIAEFSPQVEDVCALPGGTEQEVPSSTTGSITSQAALRLRRQGGALYSAKLL
mmetsp:Transcript_53536/g.170306  ORF Transcript_53536/g.170306 Transcript_53536/m.170306 type:complete len:222 (+) Transcript_53536:986-1651(+)